MTDQLETALLKAGIDLLRLDAGLNVQEGRVTNQTPRPYVRVHAWTNWPDGAPSDAMDGLSRTLVAHWNLHCVGETRESATAMEQRVRTQLLNKRLTLSAYPTVTVGFVKQEFSQPMTIDESTGVPVLDVIVQYKTTANT